MVRARWIAAAAAVVVVLAGCGGRQASAPEAPAAPSEPAVSSSGSNGVSPQALDGLDARAAMAMANRWGPSTKGVKSFVDTLQVSFAFDNGRKVSIPLPKDQMVVAIAPYLTRTHPCEVHYMSGCQGELADVPVKVKATAGDGTVLVDRTVTTMANGFFELWLPRNQEVRLSVEALGKSAEGTITTYPSSNTCITTLQLL